ncbi:hypothetical protein BCF46_0904 [Litoreibacter meonggei]|uniref:Uncharacterized protein n=1 Tax=Litoreibacter meonggei TaxID=1049199 RepID=A0A497X6G8_9RHOB|nr:hypothetical protein [Litoreibacter meonggei]RLJ60701.1 hypothetical protein BCF46_0904 [Litoreibacter meonggei]
MGLDVLVRSLFSGPVLAGLLALGTMSSAFALEVSKGGVLDCSALIHLYVGEVENLNGGLTAVHVQMFENARRVAGHLPFAPSALRTCKVSKVPEAVDFDPVRFDEGVSTWRAEEGGVFTVSPKKVRQMIREMTGG